MSIVIASHDPHRVDQAMQAAGEREVWPVGDLAQLTDALLRDDTAFVVLDVEHPRMDPLDAVRLVKGTRWDVRLVCIGAGDGAARAVRGGCPTLGPDAWERMPEVLAP